MEALLPGYKKRQMESTGNEGDSQTLKSIFVQKNASGSSIRIDRDDHGRAKSTFNRDGRDDHGRAKSAYSRPGAVQLNT